MKVLIIDDNPLELDMLESILKDSGVQVELSDSMETIDDFCPDLIILDLYMPEQSGYDICLNLKSSPKLWNIPIVMLSGSSSLEDKVRCFKAGALDYIEKPVTKEVLLGAIKKYARIGEIFKAGENIKTSYKKEKLKCSD